MEVKLIVSSGKQAGKAILVAGPTFLIGRGEECQLRPQSNLVSRKHCVITIEEGSAAIEDLGSTNHTYVNDEEIHERRELKNGDRLRVGMLGLDVQLTVSVGGQKKPKVHSVQEAAARTIGSAPTSKDDFDVSGWLGDDDAVNLSPPRKKPLDTGDTMAGKSLLDTAAMPAPPAPHEPVKKKEEEEKKKSGASSKIAGKLHGPMKPKTDSSGTAADEALRQFFHRKK